MSKLNSTASAKEVMQNSLEELKNFDWNDLGDIDSIGFWPGAVKVLLGTILFVACLGGGYWFHIKGLQEDLAIITSDEVDLRSDLETKAFLAANLEAYRQQMTDMEESFGSLLRQLPGKVEVPALLEDISTTADGSGLGIVSLDLADERIHEFYIELPIEINVNGTFHDFGTFVSGVASLARIVTLHDFTIAIEENRNNLAMSIGAKTYRYNDSDE